MRVQVVSQSIKTFLKSNPFNTKEQNYFLEKFPLPVFETLTANKVLGKVGLNTKMC